MRQEGFKLLACRTVFLAWVITLAGLGAGPIAMAQQGPAAVAVDAVREEALAQTAPVIGRLVARQSTDVATRIADRVMSVEVNVGDRVAKGDLLVRLEKDRQETERQRLLGETRQFRARLTETEARLKLADHELRRLEGLRKSAAFSQARYEDALQTVAAEQSTVAQVIAQLQSAEASLGRADINLQDTEIRAPFPGVVVERHVSEGAYVREGDPIVTLLNHLDLEVEADVPVRLAGSLLVGTEIEIGLTDDVNGVPHRHRAAVRAVIPDENPLTRTRAVRLVPSIESDGMELAAGQSVTLHLPIGAARQVVTVHKDAVLPRGDQRTVFLAVDGKAEPRSVKLGPAVGVRFEVLEGLVPGDLVVVRGNERLRPGQSITYEGAPKS